MEYTIEIKLFHNNILPRGWYIEYNGAPLVVEQIIFLLKLDMNCYFELIKNNDGKIIEIFSYHHGYYFDMLDNAINFINSLKLMIKMSEQLC